MKYIKKYGIIIVVLFLISMFTQPAFCFLLLGFISCYVCIEAILFLKEIKQKGIECIGKLISIEADSEGYKTPINEFEPPGGGLIQEKPFVFS